MSTTTTTKAELFEAWKKADAAMKAAAQYLAYDLTFRADNPRSGDGGFYHSPASTELTARLKAEYMAAHLAAEDAWALAH